MSSTGVRRYQQIEQSDGTSWMAMYTLNLLAIAGTGQRGSRLRRRGQQVLEHFIYIAHAMSSPRQREMAYGMTWTDSFMTS